LNFDKQPLDEIAGRFAVKPSTRDDMIHANLIASEPLAA
jgi:hypothetical protein